VVYKAQDTKLARIVALKFLPKHLLCDSEAKTRFAHEAKAASALNHTNITTIYEIDEVEGECFICMEYVEGKSIKELIKEKALSIQEILDISIQVAKGLNVAHKKGIVHRDIKSDNIMLTDEGLVKIMDFGLAKLRGATKITKTGSTLGTLAYMSPEQAQSLEVDQRSDIFSLGVVLYEMIAGQLPFKGEHEAAIIYSILNETPEPLARYKANVPEGLQRIIDKTLAKDREIRYQSSADLIADLKTIQKESTASFTPKPFRPRANARKVGLVTITILALIAVYLLYSRFLAPGKKPPVSEKMLLAVLPFENLGPKEQEYFAEGVTDEIRSRLSSVSGIAVISRLSTSKYKNSDKSIKQIGKELNVHYVLDGTIRWQETPEGKRRVRIVPQLIKVSEDINVWSQPYDTVMSEILTIQSDIAEKVTKQMGVVLLGSEKERIWEKYTNNEQAYDYYLRGYEYAYRYTQGYGEKKNYLLGLEMLKKAVALDSNFAGAYSQMSQIYSRLYFFGLDKSDSCRALAKGLAEKALELQEKLKLRGFWGHYALATYYYRCLRDYKKALEELDISYKGYKDNYGYLWQTHHILRRMGKWEQAYSNMKRAVELEPSNANAKYDLAQTCSYMRKYQEAEMYLDQALSLVPDYFYAYWEKSSLYVNWKGDTKKAREVIQKAAEKVDTTNVGWQWLKVWLDMLDGNYQLALDKITIPPYDSIRYFYDKGQMYKYMGKTELMRAYFDSLIVFLKSTIKKDPDDADAHSKLGVAYAGLGRKKEAISEGKKGVELMPLSKDAVEGIYMLDYLAIIYIMTKEYDLAMDQVELLLSVPSEYSMAHFQIDPDYAPLRNHPRFKRILEKANK